MIIPAFVSGIVLIPFLIKVRGTLPELIALALSIVCVATSAFFLERRCAI